MVVLIRSRHLRCKCYKWAALTEPLRCHCTAAARRADCLRLCSPAGRLSSPAGRCADSGKPSARSPSRELKVEHHIPAATIQAIHFLLAQLNCILYTLAKQPDILFDGAVDRAASGAQSHDLNLAGYVLAISPAPCICLHDDTEAGLTRPHSSWAPQTCCVFRPVTAKRMSLRRLVSRQGLIRGLSDWSSSCSCRSQRYNSSSTQPEASPLPESAVVDSSQGYDRTGWKKKPRRRDVGSYADWGDQWDKEVEREALVWPDNVPLHSVAGQADFLTDPTTDFADIDRLAEAVREDDERLLQEVLKNDLPNLLSFTQAMDQDALLAQDPQAAILHWQTHMVLLNAPVTEPHPLDRKVKCSVYLRDLQRQSGLSDGAMKHVALICGPRYNQQQGLLTLTSERYADREANKRHIMRMLHMLVEAGQDFSMSREGHVHDTQVQLAAVAS